MKNVNIRQALHEDLIQLYQDGERLTLINMRCLPLKMERIKNEGIFIISQTEKIDIYKLAQFVRTIPTKNEQI